MTIQERLAEVKALIESMAGDYDSSVEEIGDALAEIPTFIALKWKAAHRVRRAEASAVEPDA